MFGFIVLGSNNFNKWSSLMSLVSEVDINDRPEITDGKIWKGRLTFIMAASGSAVGLGNLWKFPYITGENGGGAFVLVYLICIAVFGIPLLMAEIAIGRSTRKNAIGAFDSVVKKAGCSPHWKKAGGLSVLTSYLILSFYIVVAGWCLYYLVFTLQGGFFDQGVGGVNAEYTSGVFGDLLASPVALIVYSLAFLLVTFVIVSSGVEKGIEKAINWLMPSMMIMLALLIAYSSIIGDFGAAVHFLFDFDFSKLTTESIVIAIGHSFFTLSLASAAMITYGAYMPKKASIPKTALAVASIDTLVALTAGLAIFPLVFKFGLEPDAGPGLMFISLPLIFGDIPYGQFFGSAFFFMMFIAALTSAISLMEPSVAWLEQRFKLTRKKASIYTVISLWFVSLGTVFSLNVWDNPVFFGKNFFDALDYVTANVFMTVGALVTAVLFGFILKESDVSSMLGGYPFLVKLLKCTFRYVTPFFVVLIFLSSIQ
jgi:NSS family neurotransmitter:Na+ symporter